MKAITLAIMTLAALPSSLGAQQSQLTARVAYADLNLGTKAGVELLDRRIAAAAKRVCPDASGTIDFARLTIVRRCNLHAVQSAKSQRDSVVAASASQMFADRNR